jgi:hypothetical protein
VQIASVKNNDNKKIYIYKKDRRQSYCSAKKKVMIKKNKEKATPV